jgi:cell division protein FtsI (penicillin-binding protein 3)
LCAIFALLAARAIQISIAGDPSAASRASRTAGVTRADIVDRTGALLATNIRSFTLTAQPHLVWDARETAATLKALFPDLDIAATERRLRDRARSVVYLRRGLTPRQRAEVLDRGLAGVSFEEEESRVYPMGSLAGHVLGYAGRDMQALSGVELGLDAKIRRDGSRRETVRLSIDTRIQFAVEQELARAAQSVRASGGAAIILDGRSGVTLSLASWPAFDPNRSGASNPAGRVNRAAAQRFEMGSTFKTFTVAMALEDGLTNLEEQFDLTPFELDGYLIKDSHAIASPARLRDIIAQSSNVGAAELALRVGPIRQRSAFQQLGLLAPAAIELPESATPLAPMRGDRLSVAVRGYGHGLAVSLTALAGAYTVFTNDGARIAPTLLARRRGEVPEAVRVFSPQTARTLVRLMRATVTEGTGRAADVPGLEIAGKTGTAEKAGEARYEADRTFSSFVAVLPASNPRYVIALALDEPARHAAEQGRITGGAVAAPTVGRIAARIAPMLGLRPAPSPQESGRS